MNNNRVLHLITISSVLLNVTTELNCRFHQNTAFNCTNRLGASVLDQSQVTLNQRIFAVIGCHTVDWDIKTVKWRSRLTGEVPIRVVSIDTGIEYRYPAPVIPEGTRGCYPQTERVSSAGSRTTSEVSVQKCGTSGPAQILCRALRPGFWSRTWAWESNCPASF